MPVPYCSQRGAESSTSGPTAARVDPKHLRGILSDYTRARLHSTDAILNGYEGDATLALRQAAYSSRLILDEMGALLDELEAARRLLSEVREHGLASFDPAQRRLDLAKRIAAFVGEG